MTPLLAGSISVVWPKWSGGRFRLGERIPDSHPEQALAVEVAVSLSLGTFGVGRKQPLSVSVLPADPHSSFRPKPSNKQSTIELEATKDSRWTRKLKNESTFCVAICSGSASSSPAFSNKRTIWTRHRISRSKSPWSKLNCNRSQGVKLQLQSGR